jgi:hypothetical protein
MATWQHGYFLPTSIPSISSMFHSPADIPTGTVKISGNCWSWMQLKPVASIHHVAVYADLNLAFHWVPSLPAVSRWRQITFVLVCRMLDSTALASIPRRTDGGSRVEIAAGFQTPFPLTAVTCYSMIHHPSHEHWHEIETAGLLSDISACGVSLHHQNTFWQADHCYSMLALWFQI